MDDETQDDEIPEDEVWLEDATMGIERHYLILLWDEESQDWEIDTNLEEIPTIAAAMSRVLFRMAINDIQWDERTPGTAV